MSHILHFPWVFQVFPTKIQISQSFPWDFDNFSNSLSFPGFPCFPDLWPPCNRIRFGRHCKNWKHKDLNLKDVDRGSDCEVRWAGKTRHRNWIWLAVNLFHFRNEISWHLLEFPGAQSSSHERIGRHILKIKAMLGMLCWGKKYCRQLHLHLHLPFSTVTGSLV